MDVVTTSLETLLQRATNPQNMKPDVPGIEAFCALVNKEPDGATIAVRLIALRIQTPHEREALQALNVLDTCMKKCGQPFLTEVGKFRFLNEMIKLVSPKYLGNRTTLSVRNKILSLMHSWIKEYPREAKIKEAFEMLKKQGVVTDSTFASSVDCASQAHDENAKSKNSTIFEDEEKSKLLQKLLRSKDPDDLQAANRLIKAMVREDERRVELISRRSSELQTVHNNARLLSEMLDSYRPEQVSAGELELIRELHQSCERLRPAVFRLASETQHSEEMLNLTNVGGSITLKRFWSLARQFDEVLEASVALGDVFEKYKTVITQGNVSNENASSEEDSRPCSQTATTNASNNVDSLLDLSSPPENLPNTIQNISTHTSSPPLSDLDALGDIFNSVEANFNQRRDPETLTQQILQPINVAQNLITDNGVQSDGKTVSKTKAFEDLDILSETMLQQSLTGSSRLGTHFKKPADKIPMNMISKLSIDNNNAKKTILPDRGDPTNTFDLTFLSNDRTVSTQSKNPVNGGDDAILNIIEDGNVPITTTAESSPVSTSTANLLQDEIRKKIPNTDSSLGKDLKTLDDIFVPLESIKPGTIPPLTIYDKNDISVVMHFAKNSPGENITVIVVSTTSKNTSPVTEYFFMAAVVPCITLRVKLQPPTGSDLPAHNPFLPAAAITQVLLIANPRQEPVSLRCMISYKLNAETVTELDTIDPQAHINRHK